jgi:hypothetical protein
MWTNTTSALCSVASRLYCFEQPPDPSTAPLDAVARIEDVTHIVLYWKAPSFDGGSLVTNYKIYRSTTPGGETLLTTIGNVLTYSDNSVNVSNGTIYYYRISAVNSVGEGALSNEIDSLATRVFATSQSYNGNLGGLSGADNICQSRASAAQLSGIWKAWLSDDTNSSASRLVQNNSLYIRIDGTIVANNWSDLIDGTLRTAINQSETGGSVSGLVWTDTAANGTTFDNTYHCSRWTSSSFSIYGAVGDSGFADFNWTKKGVNGSASPCSNSSQRLYCFEQPRSATPSSPQNLIIVADSTKMILSWQVPGSQGNS